jgi:hypothetical protein
MSRTQLAFNSDDLAFQESRQDPTVVATRVVSLNAVWPATATFPSIRLRGTWRSNRGDNLPMVSRSNDIDHPEPVARFNWRTRLYTALAGLVLFVGIEICQADTALLLYIFIVAILLLSSSVLLVCAAIGKNRRRYLQQLSTLMIFLVVAVGVFFFGRMYPFAIRSAASVVRRNS